MYLLLKGKSFISEPSLKRRFHHRPKICNLEWQYIVAVKCSVGAYVEFHSGIPQNGKENSFSRAKETPELTLPMTI